MDIRSMAAAEAAAPLKSFDYESSPLGPFDCLLRVKSCGICHSDIHMIDNDWGMTRYPLVPGHEVVGEVIECGREVGELRPGDRVGVGWQRSACLRCEDCLRGNDNLCTRGTGVISHGYGGFAEHMVMDARFCFPLPGGIESDLAGPLMCGGATVYSALRLAGMGHGMRIGVIGVGGLGHLAVQFAAKLGNDVTVFTTSHDKAESAARLGAQDAILVPPGQTPRTRSRFDILLNTVPADMDWNAYLKLLKSDGTLSFVGVPAASASISLDLLLVKRRRMMASVIGSRWMIREMLRVADTQGVGPHIERFPLEQANAALRRVRENKVRYRAVLTV